MDARDRERVPLIEVRDFQMRQAERLQWSDDLRARRDQIDDVVSARP
jgi:hypothetical protein